MKVVEANALTLTACSIAESDTADGATWSSTTTYDIDALVRYNHIRYQSLVASNIGNDPSVAANTSGTDKKWRILGATGPYKMLDDFMETQTVGTAGTPLTFIVPYDMSDAFALINLSADYVTVKITDGEVGEGVLFEETIEMVEDISSLSLYEYCYSKIDNKTELTRSDVLFGVGGTLEVTINAEIQAPAIGHVVVGTTTTLGLTKFGAETGVSDYSKKVVDEFGVTKLEQGSFSTPIKLPLYLHPDQNDYVSRKLKSLRAKPCLWIGDNRDDGHEALTVFGWLQDWHSVYSGTNEQQLELEIQGLI